MPDCAASACVVWHFALFGTSRCLALGAVWAGAVTFGAVTVGAVTVGAVTVRAVWAGAVWAGAVWAGAVWAAPSGRRWTSARGLLILASTRAAERERASDDDHDVN